jgi:hypothetical protein
LGRSCSCYLRATGEILNQFSMSDWRDIGVRKYLRGIWEILGNCHWKVLVSHWNCFLERVCRNMCVLLSLHWFLM